jgi:hypothetical protein
MSAQLAKKFKRADPSQPRTERADEPRAFCPALANNDLSVPSTPLHARKPPMATRSHVRCARLPAYTCMQVGVPCGGRRQPAAAERRWPVAVQVQCDRPAAAAATSPSRQRRSCYFRGPNITHKPQVGLERCFQVYLPPGLHVLILIYSNFTL